MTYCTLFKEELKNKSEKRFNLKNKININKKLKKTKVGDVWKRRKNIV